MIVIYTLLILVLSVAWFLAQRQASVLERRFTKLALEAKAIVSKPELRKGNSNQGDPFETAKRQFQLGQLVQKRDRAEVRYTSWQGITDRLAGWIQALRNWRGRKVPYAFGVLDLTGLLVLIDAWDGSKFPSIHQLIQLVIQSFKG